MPTDMFLKVSTIPGESTDEKHSEWIEVLSFSHGLSQSASSGAAVSALGGHTGGRVDVNDFSVVKYLDKASPKLYEGCCTGEHIPEVTFELCKAGGDKQKYMEVKLSDVLVSSVRPGGSSQASESVPLEEVTFKFGKIKWTYSQIDTKTGKPKGSIPAGWDLQKNVKW